MTMFSAFLAIAMPLCVSCPANERVGANLSLGSRLSAPYQERGYVLSFVSFFESIADSETNLQMDRGDLLFSRNKSRAIGPLLKDLSSSSSSVHDYLKGGFPSLASDPECTKVAPELARNLESYAFDLDSLRNLLGSDPKLLNTTAVRTAWYRHGASFRAVVVSALKVPHFSLGALKAPVIYNLSPVLYDSSESPVYAETSSPNEARIGRMLAVKGSVLKRGDEITAFRDEDETEWKPVSTWRDILHSPESGDREGGKRHLSLRVRRGKATMEVTVGFVASMFYTD